MEQLVLYSFGAEALEIDIGQGVAAMEEPSTYHVHFMHQYFGT
jgi:hypothetical protein